MTPIPFRFHSAMVWRDGQPRPENSVSWTSLGSGSPAPAGRVVRIAPSGVTAPELPPPAHSYWDPQPEPGTCYALLVEIESQWQPPSALSCFFPIESLLPTVKELMLGVSPLPPGPDGRPQLRIDPVPNGMSQAFSLLKGLLVVPLDGTAPHFHPFTTGAPGQSAMPLDLPRVPTCFLTIGLLATVPVPLSDLLCIMPMAPGPAPGSASP
jgi:hypothetical protein